MMRQTRHAGTSLCRECRGNLGIVGASSPKLENRLTQQLLTVLQHGSKLGMA
jgi:hypothetical protein